MKGAGGLDFAVDGAFLSLLMGATVRAMVLQVLRFSYWAETFPKRMCVWLKDVESRT